MKLGLLYEIEVARPWTETSVADFGHADIVDSLRRFGREVIPHFRVAQVGAAAR